jgi:uncharacterized protein (TIGR03083 family)
MISVGTARPTREQEALARDALHAQRSRLTALFAGFDEATWTAPTRCDRWSVHDVIRHLCDINVEWLALLRGGTLTDGFDPRTTPAEWVAGTADRPPADTLSVFERTSRSLLAEVDALADHAATKTVDMPYGTVPWSFVVLHLFWDAWVHERDIVISRGDSHPSTAAESRVAAIVGLVMAGMPSKLLGAPLDETLLLSGDGGGLFRLVVDDGVITVTVDGPAVNDALRGTLGAVVDSMVGRPPALADVLAGPSERIRVLGTFGRFMESPA